MGIEKPREFRIKHPRVHLTGVTLAVIFIVFCLIGWSIFSIQSSFYEEKRAKRIAETVDFCKSLFEESTAISETTTEENLKDCEERLTETEESGETIEKLRTAVADAFEYLNWIKSTDKWFDERGVVKDSIGERDLAYIQETADKLSAAYKEVVAEKRGVLQSEYDKMRDSENLVNNLFTSVDRTDVRPGISRDEYNDARNHVNELNQEDLKLTLNLSLDRVLPVIEEEERIARERAEQIRHEREEEQRKIAESWHNLDLSGWYINQVANGLPNGCEAASLLMAAKYKGYARGLNYRTFADDIPRSENPNSGFYSAMDSYDPTDRAHWIAPAPLASYGSRQGINVADVSGSSLEQLDQEVANGNPVIIYLTYNFNDPSTQTATDAPVSVPKNLHVLVLSGFNSYTGEQVFYDPSPKYGNSHPTVSKNRIAYLYAVSGYRALVVH